jgi:hypothetical protein
MKMEAHVPAERRFALKALHGVISQSIDSFITASVGILNPVSVRISVDAPAISTKGFVDILSPSRKILEFQIL